MGDVLISVRAVLRPRGRYVCDTCQKSVLHHIYMYGAAEHTMPRRPLRVHWYCTQWDEPRIKQARLLLEEHENGLQVNLRDRQQTVVRDPLPGEPPDRWLHGGWITENAEGERVIVQEQADAKVWPVTYPLRRQLAVDQDLHAYVVGTDVMLRLELALSPEDRWLLSEARQKLKETRVGL